ncbi:MAG: penicillin-binding protein 1C, partial [Crocinitomicaceae bacterium]|nr:penicillin-binding protein 1C [Crocinitomicaceae bacterium]
MILIPFQVKRKLKRIERRISIILIMCFSIWYVNALPKDLFTDSTSTVILDRKGKLLGAHISSDEQWRFQECDSVPEKFKTCIIEFEDRNFESHIGISFKG